MLAVLASIVIPFMLMVPSVDPELTIALSRLPVISTEPSTSEIISIFSTLHPPIFLNAVILTNVPMFCVLLLLQNCCNSFFVITRLFISAIRVLSSMPISMLSKFIVPFARSTSLIAPVRRDGPD